MIRVYAERKGGRCRLFVTGHANEGKDRDAVCAGVSALTEALVLYADATPACRHLRRSVRAGEVFFSCRGGLGAGFDLVVGGLRAIANAYPEHLCIERAVCS